MREALQNAANSIPKELDTYCAWAIVTCNGIQKQTEQNLRDLDLGRDELLPDILSSTWDVTLSFHRFNQRQVSPILRAQSSDRLCLKLLRWLHSVHTQTQNIPVAMSDEEFSIWPVMPTIYFMPCSAQRGLLYLPLFFHEFGHLLYACHGPEMDRLVGDLQGQIEELLIPSVRRDDLHAQMVDEKKRGTIVATWYMWTQELFCDAVGYVIGGPAFAHALSMYLRMRGPGEYHVSQEKLGHREHPVTWLRVKLLADRARWMRYDGDAETLESAWSAIAETKGIMEEYYGFYDPGFLPAIQKTIDDMLTEASPRRFTKREIDISKANTPSSSPIHLLNQAWQQFWGDTESYHVWEEEAINAFLCTDV
jgi:hypothetical protein